MPNRRNCHVFDLWNEGRVGSREWAEHRERCPICRVQSTLDRELRRQLGTMPRPRLSPELQRRVLSRVRQARHAAGRSLQGWMYGYWLAAGIAGFVLLARTDVTSAAWGFFTLLAVAALAAELVRCLGVDVMELVWWTAEAPASLVEPSRRSRCR